MSRKDLRQPQSAQMQSSARVAFGNGIETVATVSYSFATPPFLLAHSGALCAIRSVFGLPNELCILRTNWQIV